ncbi:hypothetical protein Bca101_061807 [Brassica carinata]
MANNLLFLSDLQAGRSSSSVQVRLLRFWKAMNERDGGRWSKRKRTTYLAAETRQRRRETKKAAENNRERVESDEQAALRWSK